MTTWSPALSMAMNTALVAAIPVAKASEAAPCSSTAILSCSAWTVGFPDREYEYPLLM